MRVLIGPLAEARLPGLASHIGGILAGPAGALVSVQKTGVPTLSRLLSRAEVVRLREALLGSEVQQKSFDRGARRYPVGYVCAGSLLARPAAVPSSAAMALVAVTDHADLTWRSPLTGPNDDLVGPRFPGVAGVYAPEQVESRLGLAGESSGLHISRDGMIMVPGIVAGVKDDSCLSDHETGIATVLGCAAASSELAPVAVVAAHLGLQVAAALVTPIDGREIPGGGS